MASQIIFHLRRSEIDNADTAGQRIGLIISSTAVSVNGEISKVMGTLLHVSNSMKIRTSSKISQDKNFALHHRPHAVNKYQYNLNTQHRNKLFNSHFIFKHVIWLNFSSFQNNQLVAFFFILNCMNQGLGQEAGFSTGCGVVK